MFSKTQMWEVREGLLTEIWVDGQEQTQKGRFSPHVDSTVASRIGEAQHRETVTLPPSNFVLALVTPAFVVTSKS